MGLRLYQPPVESDIQSKPAPDRAARSRSTIRRALSRDEDRMRERRRRVLAAAAAYNRSSALDPPAPPPPPATTDSTGMRSGSEHSRRANQMRLLDDRVVALFGERWAHLHAESNPSPLRDDNTLNRDPSPLSRMAVEPDFMPRRSRVRPEPTYALSSIRSTQVQGPFYPTNLSPRSAAALARRDRLQQRMMRAEAEERARSLALGGGYISTTGPGSGPTMTRAPRPPTTTNTNPDTTATTYTGSSSSLRPWEFDHTADGLDGLGDRNRSLSPEGDNVWDTLLSTLTPDPQPPSVGSSFASASAAASATNSSGATTTATGTAASSSRTSFTTPDDDVDVGLDGVGVGEEAGDSTYEPPCDSGCEGEDTEGEGEGEGEGDEHDEEEDEEDEEEEEDVMGPIPGLGGVGGGRRRRTYADVVRDRNGGDDPLELLGGIGGMQRIVRNLARREDIPDEWWAEVGLSRTLSREASAN